MNTRRAFLTSSAVAMFGAGIVPSWLARAATTSPGKRKVLVALFQRGAADGLNMIVPYGDPGYYSLRPTIAIPREEIIDLNGYFGLHPALSPLKSIFDQGQLAIVEAAGSPDPTRSHFDAQDYMESGTPGLKATSDGWLNRALKLHDVNPSAIPAVAIGPTLPRTLRGKNAALAVRTFHDFQVKDAKSSTSFEEMYSATLDTVLSGTGRETFRAVRTVQGIDAAGYMPASGARYPNGRFGQAMQQIAQMIKAGVGLEVAFAEMGGWDTHVNQAGIKPAAGQFANLLDQFGQSIAAFHQDMGDKMEDVVVVTMSEFGRTAIENGTRGTDHGHANAMLILGGPVKGGKVYGEWPGLSGGALYEGRDLALTSDFRSVLGELVLKHLQVANLQSVFPGFNNYRPLELLRS